MDIDTRLTENGIPTMGCQNKLLYSIGTMAITLGLLLVLTWVSVAFGQRYHFSFSWILTIYLIAAYYRVQIKLAAATGVVLVIMTLVAILIGYPSPSPFSVTVFILLLVGGFLLQLYAHSQEKTEHSVTQQITGLVYSPMLYTYFLHKHVGMAGLFDDKPKSPEE